MLLKEKIEETVQNKIDVFNFLRYVKIQEPGELSLDYELWPHLVGFFKTLLSERLLIVLKAKQVGISWGLAAYTLWHIYHTRGANVLMLSRGQDEAKDLLAKCKVIYFNLPDWMRIYTIEPNSSEAFGFKEKQSKIRAFASTEGAGIGQTASLVIHDEADFHEYFETNFGHTFATVSDIPESQLVIVSTPDTTKSDSFFIGLYKDARDGLNDFHKEFYGCFARPDRDEAWYEGVKRANLATPWVVGKNFPRSENEALSPISAQSCFNEERLKLLWENATDPEVRQGFIYILCPPKVGTQYVAGVDVGEGVGLDYSCLSIVGKYGLQSEVVAVIYTNEVATDLFAYEVDKLCQEYFNPLLAVENNSLGIAVTNKLLELGTKNLFYSDSKRTKVGWTTGDKNKQLALIELVPSINDGSLITRFKPQIKELMEMQWVKGKPVATGKTHGDTVISLMIANQMLKRVGIRREASFYIGGQKIW